jgi:hypothetical protein
MNTDQFAYELFVADPGSYFEMIGEPRSEAKQYVFQAVDFKAVERRVDGYFEPREKGRPLHFFSKCSSTKRTKLLDLIEFVVISRVSRRRNPARH